MRLSEQWFSLIVVSTMTGCPGDGAADAGSTHAGSTDGPAASGGAEHGDGVGTSTAGDDGTRTMDADTTTTEGSVGEPSGGTAEDSVSSDSTRGDDLGTSATGEASTTQMGECSADSECDNGLACDGVEACASGVCVAGDPIDCDDGISCTVDACDEASVACEHVPDDDACPPSESCTVADGCVPSCVPATCFGFTYQCGNCVDDDADGSIDSADPECWGACDNNESAWDPAIPGDDGFPPCVRADCYFDNETGGYVYDDCHWSLSCDPLAPWGCTYEPGAGIPGSGGNTCEGLAQQQSAGCTSLCLPLTPNGCDCFGCCQVSTVGGIFTVFLGATQWNETQASCHLGVIDDPTQCHPCTQVPSCINPCDECELCLGKSEVQPGCTQAEQCPAGQQPCGLPGQMPCESGLFCNTGCCTTNPQ